MLIFPILVDKTPSKHIERLAKFRRWFKFRLSSVNQDKLYIETWFERFKGFGGLTKYLNEIGRDIRDIFHLIWFTSNDF